MNKMLMCSTVVLGTLISGVAMAAEVNTSSTINYKISGKTYQGTANGVVNVTPTYDNGPNSVISYRDNYDGINGFTATSGGYTFVYVPGINGAKGSTTQTCPAGTFFAKGTPVTTHNKYSNNATGDSQTGTLYVSSLDGSVTFSTVTVDGTLNKNGVRPKKAICYSAEASSKVTAVIGASN
jgi:hypothetical protein